VRGLFVVPGGTVPVLRNINPMGEIDVPLIGREGDNGEYTDDTRTPVLGSGCLERGEEFTVSDEHAEELLKQPNFEAVDDAAKAITAKSDATAAFLALAEASERAADAQQDLHDTSAPQEPDETNEA
jgi:hypothetical protein